MSTTATKLITADELLRMGNIGRCELIYGELVMMSLAGAEHGVVAIRLGSFVRDFVEQHDLGVVFAAETARNPSGWLIRIRCKSLSIAPAKSPKSSD